MKKRNNGRKASVWYGFECRRDRKIEEAASLWKLRMGDPACGNGFPPQMPGLWTSGHATAKTGGKEYQTGQETVR